MLGEVQDVADRGRPEGIDRLGVVAHHGQALALGRQAVQDLGLQGVGILVLVDQQAIELPADGRPGPRVFDQRLPLEQQVVVVQDAGRLLAVYVAVEELRERPGPVQAPGEAARQHLVQFFAGVDAAAVDVHAGALLGEPPVALGQA